METSCDDVTPDSTGGPGLLSSVREELFEHRLLVASLQAQLAEISRLATATGEALTRLLDRSGPVGPLADARRTIPRWHFGMLNDDERNDALAVALERRVWPGCEILDIGSGTGLLAMMAIRAGAAHVTSCETNPVMAEIARTVVAANGMADVITVVSKRSTDLRVGHDLERPADLIVSEIVDCGLIGEGMLPTMRHARKHLLAPGGQVLPVSARMLGFLVDSPVMVNLNRASTAGGFDVRLVNAVATQGHFPVRLSTWPHHVLTQTAELVVFDLGGHAPERGRREVELMATGSGTADALVAWFEMDLGAGVVLRNSPDNIGSHWMQALIPFPQPVEVATDATISIELCWDVDRLSVAGARSLKPWETGS